MKFSGRIGFATNEDAGYGVWVETITERHYTGDLVRDYRKWNPGKSINDNLDINNTISIVADTYLFENHHMIRYVVWNNSKWKVNTVEVQRPRMILYLGGVYNEDSERSSHTIG